MYGASVDAVRAVSGYLSRHWGECGYRLFVAGVDYGGAAMATCSSADGSEFFIASDRYGSVVCDADTFDGCWTKLCGLIAANMEVLS